MSRFLIYRQYPLRSRFEGKIRDSSTNFPSPSKRDDFRTGFSAKKIVFLFCVYNKAITAIKKEGI
jgi:hypothetical protein